MEIRPSKLAGIVAFAALLCSAACASTQLAQHWTKPGANPEDLDNDLRICERIAPHWGAQPYFDPRRGQLVTPDDASQTQAACMMRQGWTLTQ